MIDTKEHTHGPEKQDNLNPVLPHLRQYTIFPRTKSDFLLFNTSSSYTGKVFGSTIMCI
jgi:hypothetical protein